MADIERPAPSLPDGAGGWQQNGWVPASTGRWVNVVPLSSAREMDFGKTSWRYRVLIRTRAMPSDTIDETHRILIEGKTYLIQAIEQEDGNQEVWAITAYMDNTTPDERQL